MNTFTHIHVHARVHVRSHTLGVGEHLPLSSVLGKCRLISQLVKSTAADRITAQNTHTHTPE